MKISRRDSIRDSGWLRKASTALAAAAIPAALAFTALGTEDGKREVYFAENSEHYFLSTEEWQSYIVEYQEAHAEEAEGAERVLASMEKVEAEEERKAEEYHEASVREWKRAFTSEGELLACLVEAEAGNQPFEGKLLVADTVLNRREHELFPDTIEDVIFAPGSSP